MTALFLHGGVIHLAGNMLYLFIFGAAVEMRFGHQRYLGFYLAAGIAGGLAMVFIDPASEVPVIGASGAIAAVLGAYFVLYPRAQILTVLPFFMLIEFVEVPALVYLLLWFGWQLFSGLESRAFHSHGRRRRVVGPYRRLPVRYRGRPAAGTQRAAQSARRHPPEGQQGRPLDPGSRSACDRLVHDSSGQAAARRSSLRMSVDSRYCTSMACDCAKPSISVDGPWSFYLRREVACQYLLSL